MALVSCENVFFSYESNMVLKNLNFKVEQGDYSSILGENGSGKSTLVKGILGLKAPLKGKIEFGDGLKRTEIGYLPQQLAVKKDFPASVYEVVLSGCLNNCGWHPFFSKKEKDKAISNMKRLNIYDIRSKSFQALSGGQQRRALLARALCATKKLLLLDEPTAGLDPVVTADFYNIVENINKELGISIIIVSHDVKSAIKYSNKILHLSHDNIIFASTAEYLNTAQGRLFFGEDHDD